MATVQVKFRPSRLPGAEGAVYYQVIHQRSVRQIDSGVRLRPGEWDARRAAAVDSPDAARQAAIDAARLRIREDVGRLTRITRRLDEAGADYTADRVVASYYCFMRTYGLFGYMRGIIARLAEHGKARTAETYRAALNSFRAFRADRDIMLDSLTSDTMMAFQAWHRARGNTLNTISFYLRILRAVYRRAVDEGAIDDRRPFRGVYTGVDKTQKRALPLATVRQIAALDLTGMPALDYARDMFMLSFMLRGMSLVDMAYLRKSDLQSGRVAYCRRKTGQRLAVAWTAQMQRILNKYPPSPTPYLLPIIRRAGVNERRAYLNASYAINTSLKKVGALVGQAAPLTMYVARHSWASSARAMGIPLSVISEGMGHDSEATTRIYLASLDTSAIDAANALLLKRL